MEQQRKLLRAQRGNQKRQLTSFVNFMTNYDSSQDISILEKRIRDLELNWDNFNKTSIELAAVEEETEESEQYYIDFETRHYEAYYEALSLLAKAREISPSASPALASNSIRNCTKLPKVELPVFDGSYDKWQGFHDLFCNFIHNNAEIPFVSKLVYLKGSLSGSAAALISSVSLSADNYEVAWQLLIDRFDNKKLIRQNHAKNILDLAPISKEHTVRSLLDDIQRHLRALDAMGEPTKTWDTLLIEIIKTKLTKYLLEKWEEATNEILHPDMSDMISFLQRRSQLDEVRVHHSSQTEPSKSINKTKSRSNHVQAFVAAKISCTYCTKQHTIYSCADFQKLSPAERFNAIKKANACINCLGKGHRVADCTSRNCRTCDSKHNTLLHFNAKREETPDPTTSAISNLNVNNLHAHFSSESLLATARVNIVNSNYSKTLRVLLDAGSQANFMSKRAAAQLKLKYQPTNVLVNGVNGTSSSSNNFVTATIQSRTTKFEKTLDFLVVPKITQYLPSAAISDQPLDIPRNLKLADPDFLVPSEIDALIGVQLFFKLLCVGQISIKNHPELTLQKTLLGWILAGSLNESKGPHRRNISSYLVVNNNPTDINLEKFWQIEEVHSPKPMSTEEQACEEHFRLNTTRTASGRFVVRLPFNGKRSQLGDSRSTALKRFKGLERRMTNSVELKTQYTDFLSEYSILGHMSITNTSQGGFYLPHHCVFKNDSSTTKIRVVFDGSASSSTGISLNDTLMVGPKLQEDLFSILVRFRTHTFVLTADIEKMYRQVLVHPDDRNYQKILYRHQPHEPVIEYMLNTVTYGTASASFLAIRSLCQLAEDERKSFPLASKILKRDFYVDDMLTGANTLAEAFFLRNQLSLLLQRGGFTLRKWASNNPSLIANCHQIPNADKMPLDFDSNIKTLGIQWNSKADSICYNVKPATKSNVTKRNILSQIAQLFDPLGLLGPVIVQAKIFMQMLWKACITWDESIPNELHTAWISFREQLTLLENLRFPRHMLLPKSVDIQLHGFCDASQKAYGACVYLRSRNSNGQTLVSLVCSKSRVAPLRSITLPRLELSGALLLSQLVQVVKESLHLTLNSTYLWCDSTITLHWLNTSPHLLKTFVSNRVAEIQRLTLSCKWRHISTLDNPADLVSRGQFPNEFIESTIWQEGPSWLTEPEDSWPRTILKLDSIPEMKSQIQFNCLTLEIDSKNILLQYSCITKLTRIVAFIFRFAHNARNPKEKLLGSLSKTELDYALLIILKLTQHSKFSSEFASLSKNNDLSPSSKLISLKPFVDKDGLLRVGGRLVHSDLPVNQKHPILLPPDHHVTRLIVTRDHLKLKHAGPQATLYSVRELYWPLNARNMVRKIIHQCVRCFRVKPRFGSYTIGNLPRERTSFVRPFLDVRIDFCGPFFIKERKVRNRNKVKVYVAVYVCLCTKAVHLEVVSDLTSEAFIGSLKRFFSRRGKAKSIHTDNATNFVGANRSLQEIYQLVQDRECNTQIRNFIDSEGISWKFIPPRSPHFGGLWEAAVKTFKHHFLRTVGNAVLTYEQLKTVSLEIEAILNSRPLTPMSSDPHDLRPLTPSHFLIGEQLTSFPQVDFRNTPSNRLSAWEHAQQLRQHFWTRWHKEYVHQLLISSKSRHSTSPPIVVGTLVLIKDDNAPPLQWSLGRVTAIHPGTDQVVRVVTLKTPKGELKRSVKYLCPLPLQDD